MCYREKLDLVGCQYDAQALNIELQLDIIVAAIDRLTLLQKDAHGATSCVSKLETVARELKAEIRELDSAAQYIYKTNR